MIGPLELQAAFVHINIEPLFGEYDEDFILARFKLRKDWQVHENINLWARYIYCYFFQGGFEGGHIFDAGVDFNLPVSDKLDLHLSPQFLNQDGHFGTDNDGSAIVDFGARYNTDYSDLNIGGRAFTQLYGREDAEIELIWKSGFSIIGKQLNNI